MCRVEEFGEPEVTKIGQRAAVVPGPGQVLVRIYAVGIKIRLRLTSALGDICAKAWDRLLRPGQ